MAVTGKAARVGKASGRTRRRPARSRIHRARAHIAHNLINYLVWVTYLGAGVAVAASNHSFDHLSVDHLSRVRPLASATAAVLAWPLVYLGVDVDT
jgi:hypothetical protein